VAGPRAVKPLHAPSVGTSAASRVVFHLPRRNASTATTASADSAMHTDQNTPSGPQPAGPASAHASGISNSQKQKKWIQVGVTRVAGAVEALHRRHAPRVEDVAVGEDAQRADADHGRLGIRGEDADQLRRQQ
jgi:hypothetical protein